MVYLLKNVIFYSYVKLPPGSDFQWWFNRVCQAFYGNTVVILYIYNWPTLWYVGVWKVHVCPVMGISEGTRWFTDKKRWMEWCLFFDIPKQETTFTCQKGQGSRLIPTVATEFSIDFPEASSCCCLCPVRAWGFRGQANRDNRQAGPAHSTNLSVMWRFPKMGVPSGND